MSYAIALCSGGPHSAVAAAAARRAHKLILVHVRRPAPDADARRAAFEALAAELRPAKAQVVPLPVAETLPGGEMPRRPLVELLPLLGIAGRVAAASDAAAVYVGLTGDDDPPAAGEAVQVWEELLRLTLGREVRVEAPLLDMEPWQRIDLGRQLDAPLEVCHLRDPEAYADAVRRAA